MSSETTGQTTQLVTSHYRVEVTGFDEDSGSFSEADSEQELGSNQGWY
jgi:hypothetical protein